MVGHDWDISTSSSLGKATQQLMVSIKRSVFPIPRKIRNYFRGHVLRRDRVCWTLRERNDWNEGIKKSMTTNESLEWEVTPEPWERGPVKYFECHALWCCITKTWDKNLPEVAMLKINLLFCLDTLTRWRKMAVNFDCIFLKFWTWVWKCEKNHSQLRIKMEYKILLVQSYEGIWAKR